MNINELTYTINGAIFEVNSILGPGFLEKVYENALMIELTARGLNADNQVPINVTYKNNTVGEYIADILVDNKVIIEIKTVDRLSPIHKAQLLNYLKATGLNTKKEAVELGLKTLVRLKKQERIRRFKGKLSWEGDLEVQRTTR